MRIVQSQSYKSAGKPTCSCRVCYTAGYHRFWRVCNVVNDPFRHGYKSNYIYLSKLILESVSCSGCFLESPLTTCSSDRLRLSSSAGGFHFSYFILEYIFIGSRLNWQSGNEMPFYCSRRSRHLPPSALSFHNTHRQHTHTVARTYNQQRALA